MGIDPAETGRRGRAPLPPFALIFVIWLLPALLSGFDSFMQDKLDGRAIHWRWVIFNSIDWLLYAVLTPVVFRASRRWPLARPHLGRNVAVHIGGALAMCVAWATLGSFVRLAVFGIPKEFTLPRYFMGLAGWIFTTLPFGTGVYFALVGIEHATYFFSEARERETQAALLAGQLAEARLGALRMQLNPHFLFNSLNAITVLVRDQRTGEASRILELLSDVLRQVLRTETSPETTLNAELEFTQRYLAIEQVRFSDRLRVSMVIDDNVRGALVPRFILQPLVENALRHGIARRVDEGLLELTARAEGDTLLLGVSDNGPGLASDIAESDGLGLRNTRERLAALYRDRARLEVRNREGGGVIATVRLPYRT